MVQHPIHGTRSLPVAFLHTPAFAALLCLLSPGVARADGQDTLNLVLATGIRYEDNLFRLAPGTDAQSLPGQPSKSDRVYYARAGVRLDKPYSLQRVQLDATATRYRHDRNRRLDFNGIDYRAAWQWHLTPRIGGTLSATRNQTLTSYADFRTGNFAGTSTQTNESRNFNAVGQISGGWHGVGGAWQLRYRSEQPFTAIGDNVQNGGEVGLRYVAASDNSITVVRRESRGEYRDRTLDTVRMLDTRFDHRETEAHVAWKLTGHSSFDARLGYLEREHEHLPGRDYSGTTGRLDYLWTPTGKLRLYANAARHLYSFQETGPLQWTSYYVGKNVGIEPVWLLTDKTTLRLRLERTYRDHRGAVAATALEREEKIWWMRFGVDWQATRTLNVNGTWNWERRTANVPGYGYRANIVGLNAQLAF